MASPIASRQGGYPCRADQHQGPLQPFFLPWHSETWTTGLTPCTGLQLQEAVELGGGSSTGIPVPDFLVRLRRLQCVFDAKQWDVCMVRLQRLDERRRRMLPGRMTLVALFSELMADPVVIASGQTYERKSIRQWISRGNRTCPVTRKTAHGFSSGWRTP